MFLVTNIKFDLINTVPMGRKIKTKSKLQVAAESIQFLWPITIKFVTLPQQIYFYIFKKNIGGSVFYHKLDLDYHKFLSML